MLFCAGVVMSLYGGHAAVYYKAGAADGMQPLLLAPLVLTLTQLPFYSVSFAGILQLHKKIEITSAELIQLGTRGQFPFSARAATCGKMQLLAAYKSKRQI